MPSWKAGRLGREITEPSVDRSLQFEVEDIEHDIAAAIHQDHVTTDDDVSAIRWGRRQPTFNFLGAGHHLFSQAGRQGATHAQLSFETGRQPVAFRQTGGQVFIAIMFVIPTAHGIAIVIAVIMSAIVIVVTIMLTMTMTVAVRTSHSAHGDAGQQKSRNALFDSHDFPRQNIFNSQTMQPALSGTNYFGC